MLAPITIRYPSRPIRRSLAVGQVADLFGIDDEPADRCIAENLSLDIQAGDLVLFTGASGSGKSSLLRAVGAQLHALDLESIALPDQPLIDILQGPLEDRLAVLSVCGLSDAHVLLRTPAELSEGQRHRFRLACSFEQARQQSAAFLLADEFAAVLDRPLAQVLAFNLRKLVRRSRVGMLCATTHEDIVNDLNPDLWVRCRGDGEFEIERREVKKKRLASRTNSGFRTAPDPTGRTSLGGIIAVITSPLSAR